MLSHILTFLPGQAPPVPDLPSAPPIDIRSVELPGALAVILATSFLLWLLHGLGQLLPRYKQFDDIVRLVVAFFGIVGPLSTIPILSSIAGIFTFMIEAFSQGSGWQNVLFAGLSVLNVGLIILGAYVYYTKRGTDRHTSNKQLAFFAFATFTLFGLPWVQAATVWYINNMGIPVWNGLFFLFNVLYERRLVLS